MQNKNGLESECEALAYLFIPINKYVNTHKQISDEPINKNVKDIINNNKIHNKDNCRLKNGRDYSNFDWTSLYVNCN